MGCSLLWISLAFTLVTVGNGRTSTFLEACNPNDLKGLNDFKNGIRLDTSGRLGKWVGTSCCTWEGISCDNRTGRVTGISLPGFLTVNDAPYQAQMEGPLPPSITLLASLELINLSELYGISGIIPPSIGFDLPNLRKLYLNRNNFTGPIPVSIGKLFQLEHLVMNDNRLSGSLPSSLGNLTKLNRMALQSNQIVGAIPESLTNLRSLVYLDLHSNSLSGHLPVGFGQLGLLQEVDLSNNSLSGKIPVSITNLTASSTIYLDNNYLEGEIPFPSNTAQMPSLGYLRLSNNRLTGKISPNLGNLVSLQRLSLDNNKLMGELPSALGNLSELRDLYLDRNRFSGHVTRSIGQLSQLMVFTISHNLIQGPLPQEMSSLQNLQILDLSFNPLSLTAIPKWVMELPSLYKLYLAGCGIQGDILGFLRRFPNSIKELDLSANRITGTLPTWIGKTFNGLYFLNLSRNQLTSEIPSSFMNLVELAGLDLRSNKLTGNITQILQIGSLTHIDLSDNNFLTGVEEIGAKGGNGIQYLNVSRNLLKGRLPDSIGKLKSMKNLDLGHNELGFELPESLGKLSSLETLNLEKNRFTGRIPVGFLKLRELKELDLSDNLLVGKIPDGKPLTDFPEKTFAGNSGLCGRPLLPYLDPLEHISTKVKRYAYKALRFRDERNRGEEQWRLCGGEKRFELPVRDLCVERSYPDL